ncbi:GNAT family N-acetyltransferase [Phyllobacterium leguminum]|uniref:Ribosomal protein S18 acetylase RimI-like enzyme n=1 Tax=Phyllobacterium leguminum TaxID=314237 RepID=A0A318T224_9HYPH|nr:GNAT family N-acetyltransferase [Phyllobacterium leguminum]PYE86867.1 ribosomal protein S18 acetylase RimI-like enzyme [Phyllobacterium leguminum]
MWLRTATKDDIPAVRELLIETWHSTFDDVFGVETVNAITDKWHSADALKKQLSKPYSEFILADDGSDLYGMAFASQNDQTFANLHQLYVRPEKQGQGVGGLLLVEIESAFPNVRKLRLDVIEKNAKALQFYEARGYAKTGRTENWGEPDSGIAVLTMEKALADWSL